MSSNSARLDAIRAITTYKPEPADFNFHETSPMDVYSCNVFNDRVMRERLPRDVYKALQKTIRYGETLDPGIADTVAAVMKDWAIEHGATHYTHIFYPLNGQTAEKHDSLFTPDGMGGVIAEFSGSMLIRGEADGSSFPSGGLRSTFEARGYTAWDVTSPAYLQENPNGIILCIPTMFLSWKGVSLDKKTPMIRAGQALNREAKRVLGLFGVHTDLPIVAYAGLEQEYFLIDNNYTFARPDLLAAGRTLFGARPPKGQEFSDQYFGVIPQRVLSFMMEAERKLYKLGVPVQTRHNEVAPNQFELAPVYEETNLANDHNLLLMSLMTEVAHRHNFEVLLHEKPFAGVNGSGKHNNWSLGTDTGAMLFRPGKTPKDNLQFITFLANVMAAVQRHNGLLKASIASATNEHRLGANEAPPAIISMFLGAQITDVIDRLLDTDVDDDIAFSAKEGMKLKNVSQIPELLVDNTDRNRTSPFAFTGNRFEFRALGSSANCASAMIALNAAVADQLTKFKEAVDSRIAAGEIKERAILEEAKKLFRENKAIHFDGNGYSDEWKEEAARRGLDCEASVPRIFDAYLKPESVEMFKKTGVFTDVELEARNEVKWEMYTKKLQIEARVLGDLAINHIIPVATRYQSLLLDNVMKIKSIFDGDDSGLAEQEKETIRKIAKHMYVIKDEVTKMVNARKDANKVENEREKAILYHDTVKPCMDVVRYHIDKLELMVDNEMWPLPKYRELLFIR